MKIKSLLKNVVLALSLLSALLISACNETPESESKVLGINFPSDTLYLSVGQSELISYSILPAELQASAVITWTSSKESVVTVSQEGVATAEAEGNAKIIARCEDVSATLNIVVLEQVDRTIEISESMFVLLEGETKQLSYTITPSGYEGEDVTWESTDSNVATVTDNGLVTAKSEGECVINLRYGDLLANAVVSVIKEGEELNLEDLVLSEDDLIIGIDEAHKIYCYTIPGELQEEAEITWEIDNENIALITDQGVLFGISAGVTNFRARCGSVVAEGKVEVWVPYDEQLEKIELNVSELTLGKNDWFELECLMTPSYLGDYLMLNVDWSSTDESIAEVDGYGIVVAKQCGECEIIATCMGFTASAKVNVVNDTEYDLYISPEKVFLPYGCTRQMNYYISPSEYQDQAVITWESADTDIIRVDANGVISSGEVPGTTTITAKWEGCESTAEVTMCSMFFGQESMQMLVGQSANVPLNIMPDDIEIYKEVFYVSTNPGVLEISETGVMTAKRAGVTTVLAGLWQCQIGMEVRVYDQENGYPYADLGLISGTKWAIFNFGADQYDEVGGYYAWGERETKEEYTKETSVTFDMDMDVYNGDISGWSVFDGPASEWGSTWMMPTLEDWLELKLICTWSWVDELPGYKVTGVTGNYIYLIAGGRKNCNGHIDEEDLYYWASTTYENVASPYPDYYAAYFYGQKDYTSALTMGPRELGMLIRPVLKK